MSEESKSGRLKTKKPGPARRPLVPVKWRPPLSLVTFCVITAMVALPLVGLLFFRLYENQLIRETEGELIGQAAALRAVMAARLSDDLSPLVQQDIQPRVQLPPRKPGFFAHEPSLDLARDPILPPRPDPQFVGWVPDARMLALGEEMTRLALDTKEITLAGFRILDARGLIIDTMRAQAASDTGLSLAHVEEIAEALATGQTRAVLRQRERFGPTPPLYSLSRGTKLRVFVAMPVLVNGEVRGLIHASRTPNNIVKHLYREQDKVLLAALMVLVAALVVGMVFLRLITRPIAGLIARLEAIALGDREAIAPLPHHGTREIAKLTQSFLDMASAISERSDAIATFARHVTHELKSPLTAIQGAAELLEEGNGETSPHQMSPEQRGKFLASIQDQTARLTQLLNRLRDLARAEMVEPGGHCALEMVMAELRPRYPALDLPLRAEPGEQIALSAETAQIVLGNLIDNARNHGATRVMMEAWREAGSTVLRVSDDGPGISPGNAERIFEPFFTTRRESGGSGMGLGIVQAMLRAQGGQIELVESEAGAVFEIRLPG
ncbi:MAG: ATP-binding protein [Neomegalonema sp.]|nr:ATP-binding protein [Neomegalonema sp.]